MRIFTTNSIFVFGAALFLLLSYQFISAQTWTNPPASPPSSNATAPLNVGSTAQTKNGDLTVNGRLNVNNDLTANDVVDVNSSLGANTINIFATGPTIRYVDSDNRDFWTHVNSDTFYVLVDRNGDGSWDSPHPLVVHANQNSNMDYVQMNQVRASEYCDRNGNNCTAATAVGTTDIQVRSCTGGSSSPNFSCSVNCPSGYTVLLCAVSTAEDLSTFIGNPNTNRTGCQFTASRGSSAQGSNPSIVGNAICVPN